MLKCHRVALKPTPEQESLFLQHAGNSRFAYNWALGEFRAGLEVGRVAERYDSAAALEQGEAHDCAMDY